MLERYVVTVSKTLHKKVGEGAKIFRMSIKDYVQYALAFFVNRKINPATYQPGKEFDLMQMIKQSTEQILTKIDRDNHELIKKLVEETIRSRLLQEAQVNLLIEYIVPSESQNQVQRDIAEYVNKTMEKIT